MFKKSTPVESLRNASVAARNLFLNAAPSDFGILASPDELVWGVVMDVAYPEMVVTLIALTDGATSIYFSSGGGIIGGRQHASVVSFRQCCKTFIGRLIFRPFFVDDVFVETQSFHF